MSERPPPLRAYLFGRFTFQRGEDILPLPAASDARSLLAHLLFHSPKTHARESLIGLFWADLPEARARRALSQALWRIRRAAPGLIGADAEAVRLLTDDLWVDAIEFESLATGRDVPPERLYRAIQLYRGDLFEGFYDDWALAERERLREVYLQALERLVHLEKSAGHYSHALDHALTLAQADPLRESIHREIMRLYVALNRPEAALKQFEICRDTLKAELALEPEAETAALAREIAQRSGQSISPYLPDVRVSRPAKPIAPDETQPAQIPLVGRSGERAELLAHVEAVFNGMGGVVLVEGEAGVGKPPSPAASPSASPALMRPLAARCETTNGSK